MNFKRQ